MQKFFSNKKMIVLMIALLASLGLIFSSISVRNNQSAPPLMQQIGNDVVGIGARVVSGPARWIKSGLDDVNDLLNAFQENKRLKAQIDDLAQTKVRNQTLSRENQALKKQLKLNATLTDYGQISATVTSRTPDDWRNVLLIDKGSGAGVKKGMPVMSGSGLLGRVVEISKTQAKVEMISTDNRAADRFAASILTTSGKTINGVVTGFAEKSGELILGQINTEEDIKKGEKVVTSGLGGATPKGLLIGTVVSIKKDDFGLANTVYLKPAADLHDASVVTVIDRTIEGDSDAE
ncbi:rod shape-determining protein MreC [Lacticaseibacillus absianus]|uniref:rod shape-determining protein MreC n=1 Tax=Lacticaseibacillus absianus TaxID=2729623 RepID=UPI0015CBC095|nr:rod shape-determining protein MreC [Lacticaseibacillus absianus]